MKILRFLPLIALVLLRPVCSAAETNPDFAAVASADDARCAATVAADKDKLSDLFSDDLVYTHGTGHVDTKASYMRSIVSGALKYVSFSYEKREFFEAAPGIVLMRGRVMIHSEEKGKPVDNHLAYLAVWRNENGVWRFLAWQSCHLPAGS